MKTTRRAFFKFGLGWMGAGLVAPSFLSSFALAEERRRPKKPGGEAANAALKLVEPGKGMAASVNYVHKTSDIKDVKHKSDRQGVPFAQQKCQNCMLYTKSGTLDGGEVGKCQLFADGVVKASGWCTSWAKKV